MKTEELKTIKTFKQNEKLLKKIAWNLCVLTQFEYEELYSEAILGYMERKDKFNPNKAAFSSYIYMTVRDHIYKYMAKEQKRNFKGISFNELFERQISDKVLSPPTNNTDRYVTFEKLLTANDNTEEGAHCYLELGGKDSIFQPLTQRAQKVADVVLSQPNKYTCRRQEDAIQLVSDTLEKRGWAHKDIWQGIKEVQKSL